MSDTSLGNNTQAGFGNPGAGSSIYEKVDFGLAPPPEIHAEKSAGASTVQGAMSLEESTITQAEEADTSSIKGLTANQDPANPSMVQPKAADSTLSPAEGSEPNMKTNAFLSSIYAVVLTELMAEITKINMYRAKVDSTLYLETKKVEKALSESIADMQIAQGQAEMYASFARAVCAGAGAGIHLMGTAGALRFDPRGKAGMACSSFVQSSNALGGTDSVFSNVAQGLGANAKAHIEAQITMLQYMQKFVQDMADRMDNDRKDAEEGVSQIVQAFQQWMNAQYQFTQKG